MQFYFFPKSMITAWNHHHQHVPTFKQPVLNMLLEIVYSFQTGVLPEGWVLHHNLGHHKNYLDGVKDESAWVTKSGHRLTEFQYTMKVTSLSYYYIIRNAFNNHARHGLRFLIGAFLVSVVFWGMCLYNPTNAVILFLLPAVAGLFGTVWYTYKHHAGLYTETKEHASWNVLDPLYNKLTGNLDITRLITYLAAFIGQNFLSYITRLDTKSLSTCTVAPDFHLIFLRD